MMKRAIIYLFTAVIVVISFGGQLYGQLQGEVTGVWRVANSPIRIVGDINVPAFESLTIEPGVQVQFSGNYDFTINGTLIAEGDQERPIRFISLTASPGAWTGLIFDGRASSDSRLDNCIIIYAYKGIQITNGSTAEVANSEISRTRYEGIHLDGSSSTIKNCNIMNSGRHGILVEGNGQPQLIENTISTCEDHGISSGSNSRPTITGNIISVSGNGLHINSPGCTINENYIYNCGGMGIFIRESAHGAQVFENIITLIDGSYGIEIYSANSVLLRNNTVMDNDASGIYVYSGNNNILQNNIVAQNSNHGIAAQNCAITLLYNNVWENQGDDYSGTDAGIRDVSEDPSLDFSFVPDQNSPMVDTGDPQSPLDPDGTRADIGAKFFNQNIPPVIVSSEPEDFDLLHEGGIVNFSVSATDANGHPLLYRWSVNEDLRQQGNDSTFSFNFDQEGPYSVMVVVDDNLYLGETPRIWRFSMGVDGIEILPTEFHLSSVYPNPFNSTARFDLNASGQVNIRIWDITGRIVQQLWDGSMTTGQHNFMINASSMPTGKYILSAETDRGRLSKPFVVIK